MISLNCTICQIPCPTIVTGSPTIILSVNRMVLKTSKCDCCDHVPHPIVTLHLQGCYYTMSSVYHTNYHYPALLYSLMTSDQRVGKTHLKIKMWVHWASCIPLGQHPIIALQPLILLHTQWPVLPAWFQFFICITPWIITIRISKNIKEQIYIH